MPGVKREVWERSNARSNHLIFFILGYALQRLPSFTLHTFLFLLTGNLLEIQLDNAIKEEACCHQRWSQHEPASRHESENLALYGCFIDGTLWFALQKL